MRRLWEGLSLILAAVFGMAGCASPNIALKPPKHPEEFKLPPDEEAKYSEPLKYPDGYLNKDDSNKGSNMPGGPNGPPGAGGMGSRGGRGGGMAGPGSQAGGYGGGY
jgi:hypothetical protein